MILKLLLLFVLVFGFGLIYDVYASPSFPEQFIDRGIGGYYLDGRLERDYEILNLEGAYYKSDGKILKARLITHVTSGYGENNTLSYGMLIDSDSDFDTGRNGFDYRYRVLWENSTWFEIYEYLPTDSNYIEEISYNEKKKSN